MRRYCIALVASAAATLGCSDTGSKSTVADTRGGKTLEEIIAEVGASRQIPAIQTAVIKNGELVWAGAYGRASVAPSPEVPLTNDTIFTIASVSKIVVAIAFAQQVEEGTFAFDDDVSAALPWPVRNPAFPDDVITWRMVLSHTSSINDDSRASAESYVSGMDSPITLADFMADLFQRGGNYYGSETFIGVRPGTRYNYSNFAIALAAYAIEYRLGVPFHEYVRERIFEPLGMERTSYFLRDLPAELLAVGYDCNYQSCRAYQPYAYPDYPDGQVRTSATEYAKLLAMILSGGQSNETSILSAASIDELLTPGPVDTVYDTRQGLVFATLSGFAGTDEHLTWGHGGADYGMSSAVYFDRAAGVGAIAFCNGETSGETNIESMIAIAALLIDDYR
jgi:CubicO group peptidase (beta-lactamase class C family)